ncbi:MAG: hypothetical protein V1736_09310 [Pseudomonadota bacterium]
MSATATQATKRYCLSCTGGQREEVRQCTDRTCPFWIHRTGRPRVSVKTIRTFCLECTNGNRDYVRECPASACLCFPFRMGRNPNITRRELTPEQKARKAEILLENRMMVSEKKVNPGTSLAG